MVANYHNSRGRNPENEKLSLYEGERGANKIDFRTLSVFESAIRTFLTVWFACNIVLY